MADSPILTPLTRRLEQADPLKWLLTGASLATTRRSGESFRTWEFCFAGYLRKRLGRSRDSFSRTDRSHAKLQHLIADFEERIGRFSVDVVIITCGPSELLNISGSSLAFERVLQGLLRRIQLAGPTVVLATPPAQLELDDLSITERLVRLEALRACALESDAILVDHWSHWEQSARGSWYNPIGYPSEEGHKEIARHVLRQIGVPSLTSTNLTT